MDVSKAFDEMNSHMDGWNWYWLSYGEKCYAFETVTAYPVEDGVKSPESGGQLTLHYEKPNVWVAEDGTEMYIDDSIASIERQNGDVICRFLAAAYADAQKKAGHAPTVT